MAAEDIAIPAHDPQLLQALLRQDLYRFVMKAFATVSPGEPFLPNWHLMAICHHLELIRQGKIKRLRIEVPPRSLKSVCASVAFPAFFLGHDPTAFLPRDDKITRLHAQSARIESGHVWLPERAPWLEDLRAEIASFPQGRRDDQVDSISQFLRRHFDMRSRGVQFARIAGV